jgi:hypothetical protein
LKRKVVDAIGSFLRDYGELLPLRCNEAELCVYNPTIVLDALDEQASELDRLDTGLLYRIRRHVFRPDVIDGVDIFKISNIRSSPVFFGDRAVKIWKDAGITGIDFIEVWRSGRKKGSG